ncbi:MAG: cyclic nucleotide-binding domain-containing protein [Ardenticatenaceae bacterium]|nr:cyclic nucleotide-binding domain-containing protein [Ardenticatenaceae bacterium]MCB8991568.1 cyclic nucleotide-binding domain-containing protein [Ardenticatenaceae bacterium]
MSQPKFGPETHQAGSIIFRQGDLPEKFYIIAAGTVAVLRRDAKGHERVVNQLKAGDFFGEIGLLYQQRRLATLQATSDVQVMTMNLSTFRNWLNSSALVQEEIADVVQGYIGTETAVPPTPLSPESETANEALSETAVLALIPAPITADSMSGPVHFAAGETIIRQGDKADKFYILANGRVEVLETINGQEQHINYLNAGDYFGEIGLLEDQQRTATVRAVTAVHALAFDRAAFRRWLSKSPESKQDLQQTMQERLNELGNRDQ